MNDMYMDNWKIDLSLNLFVVILVECVIYLKLVLI